MFFHYIFFLLNLEKKYRPFTRPLNKHIVAFWGQTYLNAMVLFNTLTVCPISWSIMSMSWDKRMSWWREAECPQRWTAGSLPEHQCFNWVIRVSWTWLESEGKRESSDSTIKLTGSHQATGPLFTGLPNYKIEIIILNCPVNSRICHDITR